MHQLHKVHRHDWLLFFKVQDDPTFLQEEYQLTIYYDPLFRTEIIHLIQIVNL